MDDAFDLLGDLGGARRGGQVDIAGLLPARVGMPSTYELQNLGFSTEQIYAMVQGRIVAPGSGRDLHKRLDGLDTRQDDKRYDFDWITSSDPTRKRSSNAENMIGLQFRERGYNIIIQPERRQLNRINYWSQDKNPDFIIEGLVFDAYAPTTSSASSITRAINKKLSAAQTDRIIVDITESKVTLEQLMDEFIDNGDGKLYNLAQGLDLKELWIRNNDQLFPLLTVENMQTNMLWP